MFYFKVFPPRVKTTCTVENNVTLVSQLSLMINQESDIIINMY